MLCFHVTEKVPDSGFFKLVIPTYHEVIHTRAFAKAATLSKRALQIFKATCACCGSKAYCPACNPCKLVAELLHSCDELNHRAEQFVEHLFEWERHMHFPHLPSRFKVLFCWESLDDAKWFRDHLRNGKGHIYFVSPVDPRAIIHRGDTRWLDCLLESVPTIQKRARAYWEGKPCPDPGGGRWELLIPCDLKVLDRIS